VSFCWRRVPRRIVRRVPIGATYIGEAGRLIRSIDAQGVPMLVLDVNLPFFFSVSVAPSFSRARPAAVLHDFLYAHAAYLELAIGVSRREVLHLADRWFFAQMDASGFLLKRTYFIAVRLFGYWWHTYWEERRS